MTIYCLITGGLWGDKIEQNDEVLEGSDDWCENNLWSACGFNTVTV